MVATEKTPIVPTQPIPAKSLVIKTDKPRPYVCATCTRSFARLEHLKRHERSHTKEKPFQCPVCERSFARRDLLLRHKQKLHVNPSPGDPKRNSISGPCGSGRRSSMVNLGNDFSPSFSPTTFSPGFEPNSASNSLNPLEHELMSPRFSVSRSQSFSAVAADSYMPDSHVYSNEFEETINPQMLRQSSHPQPPQPQQPVHMGIRQKRRFNSNASSKPFVDSPECSVASSSLSQFDSPNTVPYQSPPTEFSQTPLAQQHHWPAEAVQRGLPSLGMAGIEQNDDFVNSLLNLDDRFDVKAEDIPPHEVLEEWPRIDSMRGFGSGFTSIIKSEDSWQQQQQQQQHPHHLSHGQLQPQQQPPQLAHAQENNPHDPLPQQMSLHHQPQSQQQQHNHVAPSITIPHTSHTPHSMSMPPPPSHPQHMPSPGMAPPSSHGPGGLGSGAVHANHVVDGSNGLRLGDLGAPPQNQELGLQNLPSSQEVRRLVSAFYARFNTHSHFVQRGPDLASQNMALVMSMAALGALYLNELQSARQIYDLSCDCIRMFSDLNNISLGTEPEANGQDVPLWLVQASVLSLLYMQFTVTSVDIERLVHQSETVSSLARRARLHLPPSKVLEVPTKKSSIEDKFKYFTNAECRVRTMYTVYNTTSFCAIFLGIDPPCHISMLECGTPRDDDLVLAENAAQWWENPLVHSLELDSKPYSRYLDHLCDGKIIDDPIPPTALLALICGLHHHLVRSDRYTQEQQEKITHTWETTWSNSKYAADLDRKDNRDSLVMSDCAPIASLVLMRSHITIFQVIHQIRRGDFSSMNVELDALRVTHADELVDAAVYALDAIAAADEINRKHDKMFIPSLMFLFEGVIIISEALAVIEAMAQPVEKHQRLLMRAHKTFSQIMEADIYKFAQDNLFSFQDPAESLSRMALRVAITVIQANHPWPVSAFIIDVLRKRY